MDRDDEASVLHPVFGNLSDHQGRSVQFCLLFAELSLRGVGRGSDKSLILTVSTPSFLSLQVLLLFSR